MPNRFLYHCFPRNIKGKNEYRIGEATLESIIDYGLLLTPEHITWQNQWPSKGQHINFTYIQQRACFTELGRRQLKKHSEVFGRYGIELNIESGRDLGALPVFYIPLPSSSKNLSDIGVKMMHTLSELENVMTLLTEIDSFDQEESKPLYFQGQQVGCTISQAKSIVKTLFTNGTSPKNLRNFFDFFLGHFYPTENLQYNSFLSYYKQREWRISGHLSHYHGKVVTELPIDLKDKLLKINDKFFSKGIEYHGLWKLVEGTLIHNGFRFINRDFFSYVNSVLCPIERVEAVEKILQKKKKYLNVIPIA
jgi:hypothetical protein